jgi:hypothetical protein
MKKSRRAFDGVDVCVNGTPYWSSSDHETPPRKVAERTSGVFVNYHSLDRKKYELLDLKPLKPLSI